MSEVPISAAGLRARNADFAQLAARMLGNGDLECGLEFAKQLEGG